MPFPLIAVAAALIFWSASVAEARELAAGSRTAEESRCVAETLRHVVLWSALAVVAAASAAAWLVLSDGGNAALASQVNLPLAGFVVSFVVFLGVLLITE